MFSFPICLFSNNWDSLSLTEQAGPLIGSNVEAYDFGESIAISADGNTLLVGEANSNVVAGPTGAGAAYVFTRSGTTWSAGTLIQPADLLQDDYFGVASALSIDGNTAAIGAYLGTGGTGVDNWNGAVYIYSRTAGVWSATPDQIFIGETQGSAFGVSVALSGDGNTLLVGSYQKEEAGLQSGAAYIFTRSGGTWSTTPIKLVPSNGTSDFFFGCCVSLSRDGTTAAIGSWGENTNGIKGGAVYVFNLSGTWSETQKLTASDGIAGDLLGAQVNISGDGNTILASAPQNSVGTIAGSVYIFVRSGGSWTEQKKISSDSGTYDGFGSAVSLTYDGDTAIIGAPLQDPEGVVNAGSAYIWYRVGSNWYEKGKIAISGLISSDQFGYYAATTPDGNTIAISATGDNFNAGSVYVFQKG